MKVIILAGGWGSRLGQLSESIPKPMVTIGNKPILWHIMKIFSSYGINDFIVCCGYKGDIIREYFENFKSELWNVQTIDTGLETMTGGRLGRISSYVEKEDCFCMTYGDGLADINISNLIEFHRKKGLHATLTAAHKPGRFGVMTLK